MLNDTKLMLNDTSPDIAAGGTTCSVAQLGRQKSWSRLAMCSRDSDFRYARVDNLLHNAHVACMPLQHCNRGFCTVLQGGGRCKVHLCESACACETTCYRTTHSFTCTCTLTQINFAPSTSLLLYTVVQYRAPYCSDIFY